MLENINNVEKQLCYNFPDDFKNYLLNVNSLKLDKSYIKLEDKIIHSLLSLDALSKEYILNFQKFDSQYENTLIPFALLEFGDLLCFERETNKIVIYYHESDTYKTLAESWTELYNEVSKI